jgi:hypothetical protein
MKLSTTNPPQPSSESTSNSGLSKQFNGQSLFPDGKDGPLEMRVKVDPQSQIAKPPSGLK